MATPEVGFEPGAIIDAKYRVDRVLGEGGLGLLVEAFHLGLHERVALKCLKRDALANPELVHRFAREARIAAKLKSEYVARVLSFSTVYDWRLNGDALRLSDRLLGITTGPRKSFKAFDSLTSRT